MSPRDFIDSNIEYIFISLFVLILILIINVLSLSKKIKKLTAGENGKSLEKIIYECLTGIQEIQKKNELISEHAISLNEKASSSIRNIQMIRYKAFEQNGSNQSFSIALLNEIGDGIVMSTLHRGDRISTFAKPIKKYTSKLDLTEEEKEVIEKSKKEHRQK